MADQFPTGVAVPGGASFTPPQVNFAPLGDLGNDYFKGQDAQDALNSRRAFRNGIPLSAGGLPDYSKMADTLARTGAPLSNVVSLANSGAQLEMNRSNADLVGGGAAPGPQSSNGGSYDAATRGAEGNTKNPNSSADREYQFLDGTWTDIRQRHPELNLPPTKYGASPDQLKAAFDVFTRENTSALQEAGVPVNARTQYLAHFLGAQGATNFWAGLRSNPTAPAYQYADPAAVKSNQRAFFDQSGTPYTAAQFFGRMTGRFANVQPAGGGQPQPTQVAGPSMVRSGAQEQPEQPEAPQASASGQSFPSSSALVPPAWRSNPAGYATALERQASAQASVNPEGAKVLQNRAKAIQDAVVKDTQPPDMVRQWELTRHPGEGFAQWQARIEGGKQWATPTGPMKEATAQAGGLDVAGYQAGAAGQKKDTEEDATAANKMLDEAGALGTTAYNSQAKLQWLKGFMNQPGFYSGPLANQVKTFQQWRQTFGGTDAQGKPYPAMPQEAFDKVVSDMLSEQIKAMGKSGVGRVLLAEVQNMKNSIASGQITPATNRALLELMDRYYTQQQELSQIINKTPHSRAAMRAAEDGYYRTHPLVSDQEKANPMLMGAPEVPPGVKTPVQFQAWTQSMGIRPGDPIRFQGKYQWLKAPGQPAQAGQ